MSVQKEQPKNNDNAELDKTLVDITVDIPNSVDKLEQTLDNHIDPVLTPKPINLKEDPENIINTHISPKMQANLSALNSHKLTNTDSDISKDEVDEPNYNKIQHFDFSQNFSQQRTVKAEVLPVRKTKIADKEFNKLKKEGLIDDRSIFQHIIDMFMILNNSGEHIPDYKYQTERSETNFAIALTIVIGLFILLLFFYIIINNNSV